MKPTVKDCPVCSDKKRVRRNTAYYCKKCDKYYRTSSSEITIQKAKSIFKIMIFSMLIYGALGLLIIFLPMDKEIKHMTSFFIMMIIMIVVIYRFIKIDLYSKDDLAPPEELDRPRFQKELIRIKQQIIKRWPIHLIFLLSIGFIYYESGMTAPTILLISIWLITFGHSMYKIVKINKYLRKQKAIK